MPPVADGARPLALIALFAGATAIATSALFVKVSETSPVASAFWRVFLALPVLWAWAAMRGPAALGADFARNRGAMIWTGVFFAGDLAFWHWSIVLTSVANSTLLANLAPVFVTLAAWMLFRRRPAMLFAAGLATALAGVVLLLGADFRSSGSALLGDALGVVTAMFYAAYQLTVTRLRRSVSTANTMAWSALVMALILLPLALASDGPFLPATANGWLTLLGLALVAQAAGQSLIAYAMAHVPATFTSVGLLLQPVMAAGFAWALLGETLGLVEIAGGVLILIGIAITHRASLPREQ